MADLQDKFVPHSRVFPWGDGAGTVSNLALGDDAAMAVIVALLRSPPPDPRLHLVGSIIAGVAADEELRRWWLWRKPSPPAASRRSASWSLELRPPAQSCNRIAQRPIFAADMAGIAELIERGEDTEIV